MNYQGPKEGGADTVKINAWMTLTGKDLGLAALGTEGEIDIRIGMSGTTATKNPEKKK